MPPLHACRKCASPTHFEEVSGAGLVYTFVVQRQAAVSGYLDKQEGLRLPGRIVDIDPQDVVCDMRVQAELEQLPGGNFVVPVFRKER